MNQELDDIINIVYNICYVNKIKNESEIYRIIAKCMEDKDIKSAQIYEIIDKIKILLN